MSRYGVPGYVAAVKIRSGRTLLTEGVTDRWMFARLKYDIQEADQKQLRFVVDSAEIIDSPQGVMGNREKVEQCHNVAIQNKVDKLACVVDREFREFDFAKTPIVDNLKSHKCVDGTLFWTQGHSAENYLSTCGGICAVLATVGPEKVPTGFSTVFQRFFDQVLKFAAAYSVTAKELGLLDRSRGFFNIEHWSFDPVAGFQLELNRVSASLVLRGVAPADIGALATSFTNSLLRVGNDPALGRWLHHGRVGTEMIWSAVGQLLKHLGMSESQSQDLSVGNWEPKRRVGNAFWSNRAVREGVDAPQELIKWMKESAVT